MTGEGPMDTDLQNVLNMSTDLTFDPLVGGFPGMVGMFSPPAITDEAKLDWDFEGFSLSQLDPFEYRRLQILDYLQRCGHSSCEISCFSARNAKVYFHAFFRKFQPHSGFVHLPTFDITKVSVSLFFAILLIGALHCGDAELCKGLWQSAHTYVWEQSQVYSPAFSSDVGYRAWLRGSCRDDKSALLSCNISYLYSSRTGRASTL